MRKLAVLIALLIPGQILACSICGGMSRRVSLAQEYEQAQVVVYGHIANPKLNLQTGGGTTEFHFDKIVKDDPAFPKQKMVVLSRYLPILDPKESPRFAMFYRLPAKNGEPYTGRQLSSPAVLDFVARLQTERKKDSLQGLLFAAKHLDDADANIAEEAFLAFAQADDKLVVKAAKALKPAQVRNLLRTPDLEPEKLSMFAYLLGSCGTAEDGDYLRLLLQGATPKHYKAYEGILAGYITMKPKEGWAYAQDILKSDKNSFLLRYAALRTMRFFYNAHPEESGPQVMQGLATALGHADVADIAIQDLSKWKRWDHTKLIVACYDKSSHKSPIIKSSIVRYALACPMPEARGLVERVRREDPKLVKYLEEELK